MVSPEPDGYTSPLESCLQNRRTTCARHRLAVSTGRAFVRNRLRDSVTLFLVPCERLHDLRLVEYYLIQAPKLLKKIAGLVSVDLVHTCKDLDDIATTVN